MCGKCGCDEPMKPKTSAIKLEHAVLDYNARIATRNRDWLAARDVIAVNLMASPGAGKTALLERTLQDFRDVDIRVVEGDQATDRDAARIRDAGGRAVQINTGTGCHLEARMIEHALIELDPPRGGIVFVENVGNLVCPALFDLGERVRVVVASTTEGDDKPLKYPHMFHAADVVVLNKVDLLPYVPFDVDRFLANVKRVSHATRLFHVSATRGDGIAAWYDYLRELTAGRSAA
jgi:hydrogenase nickel incorporation protein HypB